jgi:hypothetical protein
MKKLIIIGSALVAISAVNLFANEPPVNNGKVQSLSALNTINSDTTPKKKDTAYPKKKDTTHFAYNTYNTYKTMSADTTPKKKDTAYLAYNKAAIDTTPKKKDSSFFAMK